MGWWGRGYGYFPRAAPRPKAVRGKERKKFGMTWWGRKWIELVENEGDGQRMARGRAYARAEKVFGIKLEKGKISAKVEGSLGNYNVKIDFNTFKEKQWDGVVKGIRKSPSMLGALLNNELPEGLEEACGLGIIPEDFRSDCSCPDWENPCKHIAALYYVLADEIDKAPQILFKLRGMEPETLFVGLTGTTELSEQTVKKDSGKSVKRRLSVAKGKGISKTRIKQKNSKK